MAGVSCGFVLACGVASDDRVMHKECPLCGDRMQLEMRETITRVPGSSQEIRAVVREWVCRECDYFEEAEETTGGE
jgi:C4-type Zn-finger protein